MCLNIKVYFFTFLNMSAFKLKFVVSQRDQRITYYSTTTYMYIKYKNIYTIHVSHRYRP